jgi:hypothetical protein
VWHLRSTARLAGSSKLLVPFLLLLSADLLMLGNKGIAWSPSCGASGARATKMDHSLLAVGTRAGNVTFLRYGSSSYCDAGFLSSCRLDDSQIMEAVATVSVSEGWVTDLDWTEWGMGGAERSTHLILFSKVCHSDTRFERYLSTCLRLRRRIYINSIGDATFHRKWNRLPNNRC